MEGKAIFEMPENVRTATINYLATRPYQEVYQLVQALMVLKAKEQDSEKEGA